MKVIGRDNYNRDNIDDILVKDNLTEDEANKLAEEMDRSGNPDRSYIAVADDYELYEWEP